MFGDTLEDGTAIYRRVPERPLATLLFSHGYAEHAERHVATLGYFAARGIAAYAYDLRGHGRSPGTRGFVRRFDELVETSLVLRERIALEHPAADHFLMGYSLGGLLALRSAQADPRGLAGVIVVAPGLGVASGVPPILRRLGVAVGIVAPHVPVARLRLRSLRPGDAALATVEGHRIPRDPSIAARTAAETMRASHAAFAAAGEWTLPALLVHGERDRVVRIAGPRRFAALTPPGDVTFREIPYGDHDLLSGRDGDAVRAEIVAWIRERSRGRLAE